MKSFWLTFTGRAAGCVEADTQEQAAAIAKELTGFDATAVTILPYPAEPRINKHVDQKYGVCPAFCYKPQQCAGKTSCPQRYSCTN